VVIEARISKSGDATPRAGDLTGRSVEVKPGARDVRVVIDQVLP
jgi:cytochrome c-type biogenesis protein CcmH